MQVHLFLQLLLVQIPDPFEHGLGLDLVASVVEHLKDLLLIFDLIRNHALLVQLFVVLLERRVGLSPLRSVRSYRLLPTLKVVSLEIPDLEQLEPCHHEQLRLEVGRGHVFEVLLV